MHKKKYIFFNIGWMQSYKGVSKQDKIIGGGSWVVEHEFGNEACNFMPWKGWNYGYVQPTKKSDHIKIERIGADKYAEKLDDVTVIWTATRPGGGTVVVGWYRHATVYRRPMSIKDSRRLRFNISDFYAKAKVADCRLIDADERWFEIPRASSAGVGCGMGQSNVWYAEDASRTKWFKRLLAAIDNNEIAKPEVSRGGNSRAGRNRSNDPEHRAKVEEAAIEATRGFYEKKGFLVEDRQKDNCGWDLTCKFGQRELHVEVKGVSGALVTAELTANEYIKFSMRDPTYCLAVVTSALIKPVLHRFSWDLVTEKWKSNTNKILKYKEVTSAVVSAT